MKNNPDLNDVFRFLRKRAKVECSCGNRELVGEIFHEYDCLYIPTSVKAFSEYYAGTFKTEEPKKEISHAVTISKESTVEEPASEAGTVNADDDFKLTPG